MVTDADIERVMLEIASRRAPERTLCPSEVARALADRYDWRALMPDVHRIAVVLMLAGRIELTRKGAVLPPRRPKVAYRIRLAGVAGPEPSTRR